MLSENIEEEIKDKEQSIKFEEESKDDNGYPVTKYNHNGDPLVKEVIPLVVPYLYDEVIAVISHLKEGLITIKKK